MTNNIDSPSHYTKGNIQPIEFITSQGLTYSEGNVIKYITRWRQKGGIEDLFKAAKYIEFLIKEAKGEFNQDS